VEGVLKEHKGGQKLVISVDLIQQSIELTVEGYSIELVQPKRSMPIEVLA
jgi:hypothetical protein